MSLLRYASLLVFGLAAIANCAQAQSIAQYIPDDIPGFVPDFSGSVLNRMYYQQDPTGIELGDIVIRPALTETTGYNSNTIGAADSGSSELESSAGIRADTDWTRNSLGLSFNADNLKYFETPSASYTNFVIGASGSLDLGNDKLKLAYTHSALNIAATDLGIAGVTTPVPYAIDNATIAYVKQFNRCSLTPAFAFENFSFGQSSGTDNISYASLNHHEEIESLAARFEAMPGNAGIALLRFAQAQFQKAGYDNYSDYSGYAGLDFRGDPILQLRALFGIEQRNFSGAGENAITLPSFELSALWMPTERDSFTASGSRRIDDPNSPFALDSTILDGQLAYYHELRPNIFWASTAEIQRSRPEFANTALNAVNQTGLNLGTRLIWDFTRHITGTLSYAYNDTASENGPSNAFSGQYPNFHSHMILIGITFMNNRAPLFLSVTLLALSACAATTPMLPPPQTQSYHLTQGDHIRVITYDESQLTNNFTIAADGTIAFPLIGTVQSAGLTPNQLATNIASRLKQGQYITAPSVSVQVTQYRPVSVLGEVNHPGQYPYQPGMTTLDAVALAGGFTYRATTGNALDARGPAQGEIAPTAPLQPGDIITISQRYF